MAVHGLSCGLYRRLLVNISSIWKKKEECGSTGSVLWVVPQTFSQYLLNLEEEGRVWQHRVCLVGCTANI